MRTNRHIGYFIFLFFIFVSFSAAAQDTTNRKKVEVIHADFIRSKEHHGKTINRLIGNVQLMHNGAIMSCDSAYLFSSSQFEAYSRIIIIKDDARLTGDWLNYDGATNLAQVRGNVVRLYDKTATLRTQHLDFDTKENIGHFFNGGTITNKESLIESNHGYYYSNEKIFRFSENIELRNEDYEIESESGEYNTHTDITTFTGRTNIWHNEGFLLCDYGWYDKPRDYFHFSENAYIQSKEQEIWADSIFYNKLAGSGKLYGNIQILDTVQQSIGFGSEGHFVENPREALLTRMPSVAYYTNEDNQPDTLFLRADTLRFATEKNPLFYKNDSTLIIEEGETGTDSTSAILTKEDTAEGLTDFQNLLDSTRQNQIDTALTASLDSISAELSLVEENLLQENDTSKFENNSLVEGLTEFQNPLDTNRQNQIDTILTANLDSISTELSLTEENDTSKFENNSLVEGLTEFQNPIDTNRQNQIDTILTASEDSLDSLKTPVADSIAQSVPDSTIRKLYAYFNARAYRQDIQAACDSFSYSSLDSLGRMFGRPVLWNKQQQISATEIRFYADPDKKEMLRADFLESAFIVSQEQDTFYNQIKGRDIIGHFRDNDLYLIDVIGGAQTVYYLQEDSVVANGNLAESSTMQIEVVKQKIKRIKYITKPVIDTYPIDQLPTEKAILKGFEWREAERPKSRWEICTETPRPSQRAITEKIAKPAFPITERIDAIKE